MNITSLLKGFVRNFSYVELLYISMMKSPPHDLSILYVEVKSSKAYNDHTIYTAKTFYFGALEYSIKAICIIFLKI